MMPGQPIALAGTVLAARPSGALWWEAARLLCVADLHLGKSERLARRGGTLLPPYETVETLERLAAEVALLRPETVVCLGDSFDDSAAGAGLEAGAAAGLRAMAAGRDWLWLAGNHDPAAPALGGRAAAEAFFAPLAFRHQADAGTASPEISGHYHPKVRISVKTRSVSRPCFLYDGHRVILPAFGAYTGGLHADSPALARLLGTGARAVVTGDPCVTLPLAALA